MSKRCRGLLVALILPLAVLVAVEQAEAALNAVSGKPAAGNANQLTEVLTNGNPADVAVSLANGYPLWYRDADGTKLELCLDQATPVGGTNILPCLTAEPFPFNPISFPNNFGAEAFYWAAVAVDQDLLSTVNGQSIPWSALLVMAQETGFANGISVDGQQSVFGRIRIRLVVPVAGTYRVTHPFGTRDYMVSGAGGGAERDVNQTQDLGILAANDFLASLRDRDLGAEPLPAFPQPTPPALNFAPNGVIDSAGKNIGPFLTPTTAIVVADNGNRYLADPGTDLVSKTVTINPGPFGSVFSIELVGDSAGNIGPAFIPAGVVLNPNDPLNPQKVTIDQFQVVGKLFDDGPNIAPVASDMTVATASNVPLSIDVAPFVTDVKDSLTNVHGSNPQAIAIFAGPGDIRRTAPFTTGGGGTVQRFINTINGKTTFTYTPRAGFFGTDNFSYVVQDTGGLVSQPATVTIVVENLTAAKAVYRQKFGKWRIDGSSSSTGLNVITLRTDPVAVLNGAGETPAVTTQAKGTFSLSLRTDSMDFRLNVDPLPSSAVTAAHIHFGAPGQDGPALFSLYDDILDGPFTTVREGTLSFANLQQRAELGITTFAAAIDAIMAGNAYVNVHTVANPSGEIRGQLSARNLGTAAVANDGTWKFNGKTIASPFGVKGVNAVSSNGVRLLGIGLETR